MSDSKRGKALMVLGTTSDAGKSVTNMAICRILSNMGFSVCPFKSQNMSLNAKPTADGHEISMIQELQCIAARVQPSFHVNPILLKPTCDMKSQVIVEGKVFGTYDVDSYYSDFIPNHSFDIVRKNLDALLCQYDFVVMEGAGSPAEINIYDKDIANMRAAELADADCILVTNVEWGGSFAYLLGTIMLMPEEDRKRIKAVVYNNLRGSPESIRAGASEIERLTGIPVLGIVPHVHNRLPKEDSECFRGVKEIGEGSMIIGVIKLPRISNFTDIDPLYGENVTVRFVTEPSELDTCDAVILPGTKNSISDMMWLIDTGLRDKILSLHGKIPILGICGGYQMLGKVLRDPYGIEDPDTKEIQGLGLLDIETYWDDGEKVTVRNRGTFIRTGEPVSGYQIHMARSDVKGEPLFMIDGETEGCCDDTNKVYGTYLHGVLELPAFRSFFLGLIDPDAVREGVSVDYSVNLELEVSKVSASIMNSFDMDLFRDLFLEVE